MSNNLACFSFGCHCSVIYALCACHSINQNLLPASSPKASIPPTQPPSSQYTHSSSHVFAFTSIAFHFPQLQPPSLDSSHKLHHLIPFYLAFRSPSFPANRVVTSKATNSWGMMIHNAKPVRSFLSSKVVFPQRVKRPVEIARPLMHKATLPMVL